LSVHAREQVSSVEAQIEVRPSYGLTDQQIAGMLQESFRTAQEDMQARALVEARVDADRLLLAIRGALDADGDLLEDNERVAIDAAIDALVAGLSSHSPAEIESLSKALALATESFAAMRMNRGISQALSGRHIETI